MTYFPVFVFTLTISIILNSKLFSFIESLMVSPTDLFILAERISDIIILLFFSSSKELEIFLS